MRDLNGGAGLVEVCTVGDWRLAVGTVLVSERADIPQHFAVTPLLHESTNVSDVALHNLSALNHWIKRPFLVLISEFQNQPFEDTLARFRTCSSEDALASFRTSFSKMR
jgi:hypothetical protein